MNIIVIMLDSFRADHLGIYAGDGSNEETPHINRFAQEAQVFARAYTGSFPTLPCRRNKLFYLPNDPGQEHKVLAELPDEGQHLYTIILNLIAQIDTEPAIAETYKSSPSQQTANPLHRIADTNDNGGYDQDFERQDGNVCKYDRCQNTTGHSVD